MKHTLLLSLAVSSLSFANTQKLESCVREYAQSLPEYNLPNEPLLAESIGARQSTIDVIAKQKFNKELTRQAVNTLKKAEAIGMVVQYGDEVHLIYLGVSLKNGRCDVKKATYINTADISGSFSGMKPAEAPAYFLNFTKASLKKELGQESTIGDVYDAFAESLKY